MKSNVKKHTRLFFNRNSLTSGQSNRIERRFSKVISFGLECFRSKNEDSGRALAQDSVSIEVQRQSLRRERYFNIRKIYSRNKNFTIITNLAKRRSMSNTVI